MRKEKHFEKKKNNTIQNILLVVLVVIFMFSSYKVIMYFVDAYNNKKSNNTLIERAISNSISDDINENQNEMENGNKPFDVDFTVLKQDNEDIIGWIYSENTPINLPILQSDDNDYYLRRLYTGKYNTSGSIFMDFRNKPDFTDELTIIYGHNMKNDSMFGTLQNYEKKGYYDEHKIMYLFTPEKDYTIKVFAGLSISADSNIYNIQDVDKNLIDNFVSKSDFKTDVIVNDDSNIVILSTCAYEYQGARYIVMGVLEEI